LNSSYCSFTLARRSSQSSLAFSTILGSGPLSPLSAFHNRWSQAGIRNLRDMKEHVLIALAPCRKLQVARTTALDLDTASSLLLNVLHVGTTMTDNLSPQVESGNRFKLDWDLLLGPFALFRLAQDRIVTVSHHDVDVPDQTRRAQPSLALGGGNGARRQAAEALAS
jgi:hypothetical protein